MSQHQDAIQAIVVEKRLMREKDRQAYQKFMREWPEIREKIIAPVFRDTLTVLEALQIEAHFRHENGERTVLTVAGETLTFKSDPARLRIICTGQGESPEEFEADSLTTEKVELKVQRFIREVAA